MIDEKNLKRKSVNRILKALSLPPVMSAESPVSPDYESAAETLDEEKENILVEGWEENTIYIRQLPTEDNGRVVLNARYIRVIPYNGEGLSLPNITIRTEGEKRYLYDKLSNEYVSDQTPVSYYEINVDLNYQDLSTHLLNYIVARAAKIFQQNHYTSSSKDSVLSRSEMEARIKLENSQFRQSTPNVLKDNRVGFNNYRRPTFPYGV